MSDVRLPADMNTTTTTTTTTITTCSCRWQRSGRRKQKMMIATLVVSSVLAVLLQTIELHSRTNVLLLLDETGLLSPTTKKTRLLSAIHNKDDSSKIIPPRIFVPWKNKITQQQQQQQQLTNNGDDDDDDDDDDNPNSPCILDSARNVFDPKVQRSPSTEGLLFIKIEKAASTTLAGVAARIAHQLAARQNNHNPNNQRRRRMMMMNTTTTTTNEEGENGEKACMVRLSHLWSKKQKDQRIHRDPQKSFAFTFIKEPTKRILSMFYFFMVARASPKKKKDPTDENVMKALHQYANTQWQSVHLESKKFTAPKMRNRSSFSQMQTMVNESLHALDFIGIVERLDESLVMLQLLLDLETTDILYATSSKQTGDYMVSNDNIRRRRRPRPTCTLIPHYNISSTIQEYIHENEDWKERIIYWDNLFYQAVNESLDRSIQAIGEEKFQKALQTYRHAMEKVQQHCNSTKLACSPTTGEYIPNRHRDRCYWSDIGCGYECLDELVSKRSFLESS